MKVQLVDVRFTHATNSSSYHTVMLLPQIDGIVNNPPQDHCYSWQPFVLRERNDKLRYLGQQVYVCARSYGISAQLAYLLARQIAADSFESYRDGYIDHQSVWALPATWDGVGLDLDFLAAMQETLSADNVIICGGNDNDPDAEPDGIRLPFTDKERFLARFDTRLKLWTFYAPETGMKFRLRLSPQAIEDVTTPLKATLPELIDVKITNYCPFGCEFCYQDSQPSGRHADSFALGILAGACRELRVFEVALGGGEPLLHPKIIDIVKTFRDNGITVNITSRTPRLAKGLTELQELVGALSFSVHSYDDMQEVSAFAKTWPKCRVQAQVIVGVPEEYEFRRILDLAARSNVPLTLLGYKSSGRGSQPPHQYDWQRIVRRSHAMCGVDAVLAPQVKDNLLPVMTGEGVFSMYIDMTTPVPFCAPASYLPARRVPLLQEKGTISELADFLATAFAAF